MNILMSPLIVEIPGLQGRFTWQYPGGGGIALLWWMETAISWENWHLKVLMWCLRETSKSWWNSYFPGENCNSEVFLQELKHVEFPHKISLRLEAELAQHALFPHLINSRFPQVRKQHEQVSAEYGGFPRPLPHGPGGRGGPGVHCHPGGKSAVPPTSSTGSRTWWVYLPREGGSHLILGGVLLIFHSMGGRYLPHPL